MGQSVCAAAIVALLFFCFTPAGYAADTVEVKVRVISREKALKVTIAKEGSVHPVELTPSEGTLFETTLPHPLSLPSEKGTQLVSKYKLVTSWTDLDQPEDAVRKEQKEQVHLGLRPSCSSPIDLQVYHRELKSDIHTLDWIDSIGDDYESILQKYFFARSYHKIWRFVKHNRDHESAIRSARIWYDAAIQLVKYSESVYSMDTEVDAIISDYEERAKTDSGLKNRIAPYLPGGYIRAMREQVVALDYAVVGSIPQKIREGRIDEAEELNTRALNALAAESKDMKRVITRRQGVNLELLEGNNRLIKSLQAMK